MLLYLYLSMLLNIVVVVTQVWQITPVGGIYMLLISPIVHRLLICYGYDFDCTPSIPYHIEQIVWFAASAFFFTAEFPQSLLSPGSCDHFFHGHQVPYIVLPQNLLVTFIVHGPDQISVPSRVVKLQWYCFTVYTNRSEIKYDSLSK